MQLIIILVFWLLRPFTASWHSLQDRFRALGKADWPRVKGTVVSCDLRKNEYTWRATLVYYYAAEGDYWSGETWRQFVAEKDAEYYTSSHPKDSAVMVRACPGKPGKSVVLADDQMLVSAAGSI
jgi:hypothetical protein